MHQLFIADCIMLSSVTVVNVRGFKVGLMQQNKMCANQSSVS